MSNGLWSQLGATDIVQSCGAELAEVLTQVDLLIEKKRQEWDMDLRRAEETAKQAISREKDSNSRLEDQQRRYEETISSLRVDLGKLKEAYLKLEKHSSGRPDKYKRILHEKKSKLELTERELKNYKQHNEALQTENAQLKIQIKNLTLEKDSDRLKLIMAQKEIDQMCDVKDENEILYHDLEKLKRKYTEVKKMAGKMSIDMKNERTAFVDSVQKIQSTPSDSPRSQTSNVVVLPLPLLNLDESILEDKENMPEPNFAIINQSSPLSTPRSTNSAKYREEDAEIINKLNSNIASYIQEFTEYVDSI